MKFGNIVILSRLIKCIPVIGNPFLNVCYFRTNLGCAIVRLPPSHSILDELRHLIQRHLAPTQLGGNRVNSPFPETTDTKNVFHLDDLDSLRTSLYTKLAIHRNSNIKLTSLNIVDDRVKSSSKVTERHVIATNDNTAQRLIERLSTTKNASLSGFAALTDRHGRTDIGDSRSIHASRIKRLPHASDIFDRITRTEDLAQRLILGLLQQRVQQIPRNHHRRIKRIIAKDLSTKFRCRSKLINRISNLRLNTIVIIDYRLKTHTTKLVCRRTRQLLIEVIRISSLSQDRLQLISNSRRQNVLIVHGENSHRRSTKFCERCFVTETTVNSRHKSVGVHHVDNLGGRNRSRTIRLLPPRLTDHTDILDASPNPTSSLITLSDQRLLLRRHLALGATSRASLHTLGDLIPQLLIFRTRIFSEHLRLTTTLNTNITVNSLAKILRELLRIRKISTRHDVIPPCLHNITELDKPVLHPLKTLQTFLRIVQTLTHISTQTLGISRLYLQIPQIVDDPCVLVLKRLENRRTLTQKTSKRILMQSQLINQSPKSTLSRENSLTRHSRISKNTLRLIRHPRNLITNAGDTSAKHRVQLLIQRLQILRRLSHRSLACLHRILQRFLSGLDSIIIDKQTLLKTLEHTLVDEILLASNLAHLRRIHVDVSVKNRRQILLKEIELDLAILGSDLIQTIDATINIRLLQRVTEELVTRHHTGTISPFVSQRVIQQRLQLDCSRILRVRHEAIRIISRQVREIVCHTTNRRSLINSLSSALDTINQLLQEITDRPSNTSVSRHLLQRLRASHIQQLVGSLTSITQIVLADRTQQLSLQQLGLPLSGTFRSTFRVAGHNHVQEVDTILGVDGTTSQRTTSGSDITGIKQL